MNCGQLEILNETEILDKTFLIGDYSIRKAQSSWILKNNMFYVEFSPMKESLRNGTISSGELPDYVVFLDSTGKKGTKIRLFQCTSYSIYDKKVMEELNFPKPTGSYIVYCLETEYDPQFINIKQLRNYSKQKYPEISCYSGSMPYVITGMDIVRANAGDNPLPPPYENVRIIDLFAGLGGFHHAFNKLGREQGFAVDSVFVSELKADLRQLYAKNYRIEYNSINPDITLLSTDEEIELQVPEHDILCGGFPCQPFSKAGKQEGFDDEEGRGALFNYIANIIRVRRPKLIFLENVANLKTHDDKNTWKVIYDKLSNKEDQGGLNYDVREMIISPHEYGFPQYRKRIYIVGIDRNIGDLSSFKWPQKPQKAHCDITSIMESTPTHPQPIKDVQMRYIQVWQQFLNLCVEHHAKLPSSPIWAMEFGADYDYKEIVPAQQPLSQLQGKRGKLGEPVHGNKEECISQLPNYAQPSKRKSKSEENVFPQWKIKFIKENRDFYDRNREWIDIWKEQIRGWDNSFMKFEWNCDEDSEMTISDKILQFRPSGLRVKRPTYSPALTFMNSQVPIFPGATFKDDLGNIVHGRFMTMVEAARIQGMGELSFEGLKKARIYEALGNAVDVEIVKLIAKCLLKCL